MVLWPIRIMAAIGVAGYTGRGRKGAMPTGINWGDDDSRDSRGPRSRVTGLKSGLTLSLPARMLGLRVHTPGSSWSANELCRSRLTPRTLCGRAARQFRSRSLRRCGDARRCRRCCVRMRECRLPPCRIARSFDRRPSTVRGLG